MAMNKKERDELDSLKAELAKAKAFRFTEPVERDVFPPTYTGGLRKGWDFNGYNGEIAKCCTSAISHSWGDDTKTSSQNARSLFSTRLLALEALRFALEHKYATHLAKVDSLIASAQGEPQQ